MNQCQTTADLNWISWELLNLNWNRTKNHTSFVHWYKCIKNHHLLLNHFRCSWGLLQSGILCKSLGTTWSYSSRTCWVPRQLNVGLSGLCGWAREQSVWCAHKLFFWQVSKGFSTKWWCFWGAIQCSIAPFTLFCSLSSPQPTISWTSAARGTAEGVPLTLLWMSATVPVLLQHPWILLDLSW